MKLLHICIQVTCILILAIITSTSAEANFTRPHRSNEDFTGDIYENRIDKNIVFSPISAESVILLVYFGAAGTTAQEIHHGLKLGETSRREIANKFRRFLNEALHNTMDKTQLELVNRIYLNRGLEVRPAYQVLAKEVFDTSVKNVDFENAQEAVDTINSWIEERTLNRITNVISESDISADTQAVIVNAIHFKSKWAKPFSKAKTRKSNFYISASKKVSVDMMRNIDFFEYAELPQLDATAIQLRYDHSTISMLLVLPNKIDGLEQLERSCDLQQLNVITSAMRRKYVSVVMPKFRIEFEVDLKKELLKLGIKTMFTARANFKNLLKNGNRMEISQFIQKAYLDVNEAGSEAAAVTLSQIRTRSAKPEVVNFRVNHPFLFVIYGNGAIYFIGHVTRF